MTSGGSSPASAGYDDDPTDCLTFSSTHRSTLTMSSLLTAALCCSEPRLNGGVMGPIKSRATHSTAEKNPLPAMANRAYPVGGRKWYTSHSRGRGCPHAHGDVRQSLVPRDGWERLELPAEARVPPIAPYGQLRKTAPRQAHKRNALAATRRGTGAWRSSCRTTRPCQPPECLLASTGVPPGYRQPRVPPSMCRAAR